MKKSSRILESAALRQVRRLKARKSGVLFHIKFSLRGRVLGNGGSAEHLYPGALRDQTQVLLYLGNALSLVLSRYRWFSAATMLMTVQ